jgi:pyrrolidone-carboxylate peptidase
LVSGFAPFGGANLNASSEGAKLVNEAEIRKELVIPRGFDLSLEIKVVTDVDVVWTCGTERLSTPTSPPRSGAPVLRGGRAIVQEAKAMSAGLGADLVLLVGESAALHRDNQLLRLDHFARNLGRNTDSHVDNDGNRLSGDRLELFPGQPQSLESNIPRSALQQLDGSSSVELDAAGTFVCNESYYQLLHEAYFGEDSDSPSGRWVQLAHVAALRTGFDAIGAVLNRTIGVLLQQMLLAPQGLAGRVESAK